MSAETIRGDRMHDERRAFARRTVRSPGYKAKHAGKTPGKICSCEMCGNPRRHFGEVTVQERRILQDDREQQNADFWDGIYPECDGIDCPMCDPDGYWRRYLNEAEPRAWPLRASFLEVVRQR